MRSCVLCGVSIDGRNSQARFCSGACRAEGSRFAQILRGDPAAPYPSVAERLSTLREGHRLRPNGRNHANRKEQDE